MTTGQSGTGKLAKASIKIFFDSTEIQQGNNKSKNPELNCRFNPKEYTLARQNQWKAELANGTEIGVPNFVSGQPAKLTLQLLFDDYDIAPGDSGTDLEKSTEILWKAMRIESTAKKPPICQFCWGEVWSFRAVITSLSQKFILFSSNGKPLRSLVDISFMQVEEEDKHPKQNPTSGGGAGEHLRIVRAGDTLAGIAFEEYGDPTVWRHLADTNKIRNPLSLSPGQTLLISPLPLV